MRKKIKEVSSQGWAGLRRTGRIALALFRCAHLVLSNINPWRLMLRCLLVTGIALLVGLPTRHIVSNSRYYTPPRIYANLITRFKWKNLDVRKAEQYVNRIFVDTHGHCTSFRVNAGSTSYTVTNKHCCGPKNVGKIMWAGNIPETILFVHPTADVCLLTNSTQEGLNLSNDGPRVGGAIMSMGFPRGRTYEKSYGSVISTREVAILSLFGPVVVGVSTSALTEPGGSGSPVFNPKMEVVGAVFLYETDTHRSVFVDVAYIKQAIVYVDSILNGESSYDDVSEQISKESAILDNFDSKESKDAKNKKIIEGEDKEHPIFK